MSERKDERWLDKQLQRAVAGAPPVFDAEAWKRKHRAAYEVLLSRKGTAQRAGKGLPGRSSGFRWWWGKAQPVGLGRRLGGLAVAAAVMVLAGVLLFGRLGPESQRRVPQPRPVRPSPASSAAQMMTMMSLQAAYQRGGTEALERQFDQALKMLGPRTTSMSLKELLQG